MEPDDTLSPLAGGWSGRTFRSDRFGQQVVVRLFPPEESAEGPEVQASLLRLVRGLVPVPEVLEAVRASRENDSPGLLVTTWVDGICAEQAWPSWDAGTRSAFGAAAGRVAGTLAGMAFLTAGELVDRDLTVRPWPPYAEGLRAWVEAHQSLLIGWTDAERTSLRQVAEEAQAHLDEVDRVCLVHSDLNPKNIVVDPVTGAVRAVVDWEYAHAGHPATDLGNLLRLRRDPAYAEAVLEGWAAVRGGEPGRWLGLARCADLWALVELAARRTPSPPARRAGRLLLEIARRGDVGVWPGDWPVG